MPQVKKPLFVSGSVTLVVVAHPDDETVLHGECIHRALLAGGSVHVAFATVGEASTVNKRFWRPEFVRHGRRWHHEVPRALMCLGVSPANLHQKHLPDGAVNQHVDALAHWLKELMLDMHA